MILIHLCTDCVRFITYNFELFLFYLSGAQNHDWHHEHFDYNYGTAVFMDKLFGTNFIGSERYVRVMKRKLLKKNEQKNEQKNKDVA